MSGPAAALSRRLAARAEEVCRTYLPAGRRQGRYWIVGDVSGAPGASLFVRLVGPVLGPGAAGKWTDAATGEHGDLLDLIAATQNCRTLKETLAEARRFLGDTSVHQPAYTPAPEAALCDRQAAARRLFALGRPIAGTLAEAYLLKRGLADLRDCGSLRFHPHCYHRADDASAQRCALPALLAAVSDTAGRITGVQRTWLDPKTNDKAALAAPRKALGRLHGNGVRFGAPGPILLAGEGVETLLALRQALDLPAVACLSASHLAAFVRPSSTRRLYIAVDDDPAGRRAAARLAERARQAGLEIMPLSPLLDDFNTDLLTSGRRRLAARLRPQLAPGDVARVRE